MSVFKWDAICGSDMAKKTLAEERTAEVILQQITREESMCKSCFCQQTGLNQLISSCKVSACA